MKYKAKVKDCNLQITAKAGFGEEINQKELISFSSVYIRGFFKPRMIRKKVIEYSGPVGISLFERLKKPLTKRDFLFIMEQIVMAVRKISLNNLSVNKMVLDIRNVYINEVTKEILFLYVPTNRDDSDNNLMNFVEAIVYSVQPAAEQDTDYVSRFVYYLKNLKRFDPDKIEAFIAVEDRSVVNTIKRQNKGQSDFMTSKQRTYYAHYDQVAEDEPTGLLDPEDGSEATACLEEENDGATGLLDSEEEEGTALLDEQQSPHFPTLYRVLTQEIISVNKPVFRVGKEKSYVDYFVTNNNAVSRSHADIITRGSKHFVIDLNSKNHTYLNDQMIPVQCETEIRDGDKLRLGNEEFLFYE